jgi:cellulose-binding protein
MDWTIKGPSQANHNPEVVVNGQAGKAPVRIDATVGAAVTLDAGGTRDPDGHTLKYTWVFYSEAGTGIPGQPVSAGGLVPIGGGGTAGEGGIPSGPEGGPREPAPRVTLQNAAAARVTVAPHIAGTAHIILAVEDDGSPTLTSYRRVILTIKAK